MLLEFETWDCGAWMLEFGVNGWCIINGDSTEPAPELLEAFERRFWIDAIGIGCITVRGFVHLPVVAPVVNKVIPRALELDKY